MEDEEMYYMIQGLVSILDKIDPQFLPSDMQWTGEEQIFYEQAQAWLNQH